MGKVFRERADGRPVARVATGAETDLEEIMINPHQTVEPVAVSRLSRRLRHAVPIQPCRMKWIMPISAGN
jgi:hypothetical protein